ncbi:MAG: hypothetical protein OXJ36_00925 [bacterium]|nr:hypothetical protein [bacterium]MDE0436957.1 hypothetical protein [bacterium]
MDDERNHEQPASAEAAEAPDLATILTGTVRSAALRLPRDRPLPVVYVVAPCPQDRP